MIITSRTYVELEEQTNYLILGFWSPSMSYKLSDAGIPVVKVQDGTSLGYSVYSLKIAESTIGESPASTGASEWSLVESADFIYMQNAYIERLQAALVTAEAIEALMIRTKNLQVLDGAKLGSLIINNGEISSSYSRGEDLWDYSTYPPRWLGYYTASGELRLSVDLFELTKNSNLNFNKIRIEGDKVIVENNTVGFSNLARISGGSILVEKKNNMTGVIEKFEIASSGIYKNGTKVL